MWRLDIGEGVELDVYNTHLEAGGSDEDALARSNQVDQIIAAMERWSQGRPILFMGDTNCHGDDPEDVVLIDRLIDAVGLVEGCDAISCAEPGRTADVDFMGVRKAVCIEFLPDIRPGEFVVTHAGFAISRMDPQEAETTLDLMRKMAP